MFDATAGRQAITNKIDQMTDRFAAEFEDRMSDLSMSEREALVAQLLQVMSGTDSARNFATNSAGQPAAQLGTGTTTATPNSGSNAQEGLQAILNDGTVDPGIKLALRRLLTPGDPEHIPVGRDGTPSELVAAKRERDAARVELTNERDVNRNGSLAKQLADVTAARDAALNSASGYDQDEARSKATAVITAINAQKGKLGGQVEGKDDVRTKFGEFIQAVGLRRQP